MVYYSNNISVKMIDGDLGYQSSFMSHPNKYNKIIKLHDIAFYS